LGERAGNAALEQVVAALEYSSHVRTQVRTENLSEICSQVARASGRTLPEDRPVTGSSAFLHESGIHCSAQVRDPRSYEPFPAASVGQIGMRFVAGKHSGSTSILTILAEHGVTADFEIARRMLPLVRSLATRRKRALRFEELFTIYQQQHTQAAVR